MKISLISLAITGLLAAPAFAEGDAAKGEKAFNQCQTCHVAIDADGKTVAGRNAKVGPNLYGVIGRKAGSLDGFKYGPSIVQAGEAGLIWDEATFVEYVQDPTKFLKANLNNPKAKGRMTFKVKTAEQAADLYAFLVSIGPVAPEAAPEAASAPAPTN
ncbi:MAG: c-type cytochrome [Paracoccaceae bacterium]|nr:c-type cytochrome [Paracoccaceae bacterium]